MKATKAAKGQLGRQKGGINIYIEKIDSWTSCERLLGEKSLSNQEFIT